MAAKTAAPPKDPEQTEIDDGEFKIPRDEEIEGAADRYRDVRDQRMELTEEEVETREALEKLLHDKGVSHYRYRPKGSDDYFEIALEAKEKAVVRKAKAPKVD
jgi:hypothetical protein